MTFIVFVLSGTMLLVSGSMENIWTKLPFDTLEACEAFAAKLPDAIAARGDIESATWRCRPEELPVSPEHKEPLAPMREAR